ncbi:hypothetical protein FB45DRAFT_3127 [Roridomyces roridus]|uniref:Protein kinase domain-containing protein n=1 Tax=Roridomyces roridus TaxID=1738132 RepID=A0AAD7CI09_9AGAR|nr:hypothetical protein FB45DRAFT_3127 [Roridomyces roridus]
MDSASGRDSFAQTREPGRGTVIIKATVLASPGDDHNGTDVVVKWVWSSETRTTEVDFVWRARTLAEMENPDMLDHLPNFFHSEEIGVSGALVLRLVVQESLKPLDDSTLTAAELAKAFKDIFECYRWLVEVAKILHRDISIPNLMYRRKNDQIYGVLNDFDLVHSMGEGNPPMAPSARSPTWLLTCSSSNLWCTCPATTSNR